ncbi:MAG: hypothetical protein MJY82_04425 [Fibrobacter sp.]|nr:hypothetical protein [Fibrobacter sp.]
MANHPPLRSIRKTTILVLVVFLAFFVHRFYDMWVEDHAVQDVAETELSPAQSVVCRNVVRGTPFGVDSVFEENTRLYFYSTISNAVRVSADSLVHIWFWGTDTIQVLPCDVKMADNRKGIEDKPDVSPSDFNVCHTEISPTLLKPGEWSVDLVAGRKLLSSRQFLIEAAGR